MKSTLIQEFKQSKCEYLTSLYKSLIISIKILLSSFCPNSTLILSSKFLEYSESRPFKNPKYLNSSSLSTSILLFSKPGILTVSKSSSSVSESSSLSLLFTFDAAVGD